MTTPDPLLKGISNGNCNRTACQKPHAVWYHEGIHAYYCLDCAVDIQRAENEWALAGGHEPTVLFHRLFASDNPLHLLSNPTSETISVQKLLDSFVEHIKFINHYHDRQDALGVFYTLESITRDNGIKINREEYLKKCGLYE